MKGFIKNGVSFNKYNIRSESMAVVNIVITKVKISDQAMANHSRRSIPQHSAEKFYFNSQSECIQQGLTEWPTMTSVILIELINNFFYHVAFLNLSDIISFFCSLVCVFRIRKLFSAVHLKFVHHVTSQIRHNFQSEFGSKASISSLRNQHDKRNR